MGLLNSTLIILLAENQAAMCWAAQTEAGDKIHLCLPHPPLFLPDNVVQHSPLLHTFYSAWSPSPF